jgi:hypothetical protein
MSEKRPERGGLRRSKHDEGGGRGLLRGERERRERITRKKLLL